MNLESGIGRQLFGENFTPPALIDEMLGRIPAEVYRDPRLRWLDPCAGVGNFPDRLLPRLMEGLAEAIPCPDERRGHIVANMLFMVEIQASSAAILRATFGATANIATGDFLAGPAPGFPSSFDVVVGNPPYERIVNGMRSAKNDNQWSKFIERGFGLLADRGLLLFVTPPAWMSPTNRLLKDIFLRNEILYLNIQECARHFSVGSKFSYYLIRKAPRPPRAKTRVDVKFDGGKSVKPAKYSGAVILPAELTFIPQLCTPTALAILRKTCFDATRRKFPVAYDSDLHRYTKRSLLSETRDATFRHEVAHTPKQTLWASRPHKHQGQVKLFIPLTTYYESMFVGRCGNTQGLGYLLCTDEEEAEKLRRLLLTSVYRFVAGITRWSNFTVPEVMRSLPFVETSAVAPEDIVDPWVEDALGLSPRESAYLGKHLRGSA